jgi:DNA-binding transcriptional LysR family regulator
MPISAYKMIVAPVLADFQARYPDVHLDLSINEGLVGRIGQNTQQGMLPFALPARRLRCDRRCCVRSLEPAHRRRRAHKITEYPRIRRLDAEIADGRRMEYACIQKRERPIVCDRG